MKGEPIDFALGFVQSRRQLAMYHMLSKLPVRSTVLHFSYRHCAQGATVSVEHGSWLPEGGSSYILIPAATLLFLT